jgi:hypothetical protein
MVKSGTDVRGDRVMAWGHATGVVENITDNLYCSRWRTAGYVKWILAVSGHPVYQSLWRARSCRVPNAFSFREKINTTKNRSVLVKQPHAQLCHSRYARRVELSTILVCFQVSVYDPSSVIIYAQLQGSRVNKKRPDDALHYWIT